MGTYAETRELWNGGLVRLGIIVVGGGWGIVHYGEEVRDANCGRLELVCSFRNTVYTLTINVMI